MSGGWQWGNPGGWLRRHPSAALGALFVGMVAVALVVVGASELADRRLIGNALHPGLQGELLFQQHMLFNVSRGNIFRHFESLFLGYPEGCQLGFPFVASLHLYLSLPWTALLGPVGGFNMSALFLVLLNLFAFVLLARALFSSWRVVLTAALLATLNSYLLLKLNSGFHQKLSLFFVPLYLLSLLQLWRTGRVRHLAGASFWLLVGQFSYPPYALFLALTSALLPVAAFLKGRREGLVCAGQLAAIGLVVAVVSGALYRLMGFSLTGELGQSSGGVATDLNLEGTVDLFFPFGFGPYHSDRFWGGLRVGISALAVALGGVAVVRGPGLGRLALLLGVVLLVLGAGPVLRWRGAPLVWGGQPLWLPFHFVVLALPGAGSIALPFRLLGMAAIMVAVAAGYGLEAIVQRIGRRLRELFLWLAPVVVAVEAVLLAGPLFPPVTTAVELPAAVARIDAGSGSAVLFLPDRSDRKLLNLYGFYAGLRGVPLVNDYDNSRRHQPRFELRASVAQVREQACRLAAAGVREVVVVEAAPGHCPDCMPATAGELAALSTICRLESFPGEGLGRCRLVAEELGCRLTGGGR